MSKDLKVTDKRIFTPEGDLKDEFQHLKDQPPPSVTVERPAEVPSAAKAAAEPAPKHSASKQPPSSSQPSSYQPSSSQPSSAQPSSRQPSSSDPRSAGRGAASPAPPYEPPEMPPRLELPGTPPGFGAPTFYDLVAVLAEPVSLYLGDIPLPDGQNAENMEMARLHIDLLDVLRQKTMGNVSAQESAVLEDVLYRLRLRYVQKRG